MSDWETVLGFEIHIELATNSKMFCPCSADHFQKPANTQICPVCLGLPGALPVPNRTAIEWCLKLGLALNCQINLQSKFDRKNYFYPDLPKGYQISQYDQPFCHSGYLDLPSGPRINITRVHMEEDTAKLIHRVDASGNRVSEIDFNRSGVPLIEVVTEPDFNHPDDGVEFLKELQQIVRVIGISRADMEKGSMRLEANVSVRPAGQTFLPDYKVEIKNVNSFRFIKKAIEYDVDRQISLLQQAITPDQETRGFNEDKGQTFPQRKKEKTQDYRYFPEPDIPPFEFTEQQIEALRSQLPPLPATIRSQLIAQGVSPAKAAILAASPTRLAKFNDFLKTNPHVAQPKLVDFVLNLPEQQLAAATYPVIQSVTDPAVLEPLVTAAIAAHPKAVTDFQAGKQQAIFALVGYVRRSLPSADILTVQNLIRAKIS